MRPSSVFPIVVRDAPTSEDMTCPCSCPLHHVGQNPTLCCFQTMVTSNQWESTRHGRIKLTSKLSVNPGALVQEDNNPKRKFFTSLLGSRSHRRRPVQQQPPYSAQSTFDRPYDHGPHYGRCPSSLLQDVGHCSAGKRCCLGQHPPHCNRLRVL